MSDGNDDATPADLLALVEDLIGMVERLSADVARLKSDRSASTTASTQVPAMRRTLPTEGEPVATQADTLVARAGVSGRKPRRATDSPRHAQ